MHVTRFYTGDDGRSHFEDVELPFRPAAQGVETAASINVDKIFFRKSTKEANAAYEQFHNAPRRQYVLTIAGRLEIEMGDGSKREFGPGDMFLAEDTTGEGHAARVIGDETRIALFMPLAD